MSDVTAKLDGEFIDIEWYEGDDRHNLLIKPEDVLANKLAVEYYSDKLTLNKGQRDVISDLFEAIDREEFENKAGGLKNFIPYQTLWSYIFGKKAED